MHCGISSALGWVSILTCSEKLTRLLFGFLSAAGVLGVPALGAQKHCGRDVVKVLFYTQKASFFGVLSWGIGVYLFCFLVMATTIAIRNRHNG